MFIRRNSSLISVFLPLLVVALWRAGPASASDPVQARPWPLPIAINLTSSFAEYRAGHLHAGLDIKTYGREGVPCIAVGDGYVSRLRASPHGYGKAVYLTLEGGEVAVYAHLSEFSPSLELALFEEQKKENRYRVDVYFDRDRFPVTEGEILAYTGRTGASAPHLHFEFRDKNQNPVNPLSHGWTLEDNQAPVIRGVVWIPLDAHSRIDGLCRARDVKVKRTGPGTFVAVDTVHVRGRVGIGADIVDRLNKTSGRLAPYTVELSVDGVLFTSIKMESFSYGHTGEVELAYDMERVRRNNRHYLLLFRRAGESLWNRVFQNGGVIAPDQLEKSRENGRRVHTAVVRTFDRNGNVGITSIPFVSSGEDPPPAVTDAGGLAGCYFFGELMSVQKAAFMEDDWAGLSALAADGAGAGFPLALDVGRLPGPRALRSPANGEGPVVHLFPVRQGKKMFEAVESLGAGISLDERSLFTDAFMFMSAWPHRQKGSPELIPGGSPVVVGPVSLAFKRSADLWFVLTGPVDGREAVYRLDERKNEWRYNGSEARGDTVYTGIRSPGVYRVFVDTQPPRISTPVARWRKSYATGDASPEIAIGLADEGSGVDPASTEVRINGEKQIARWDAFVKTMFVLLRDRPPPGAYELSVVAVDNVGNRSTLERRVALSEGKGGEESEDDAQ